MASTRKSSTVWFIILIVVMSVFLTLVTFPPHSFHKETTNPSKQELSRFKIWQEDLGGKWRVSEKSNEDAIRDEWINYSTQYDTSNESWHMVCHFIQDNRDDHDKQIRKMTEAWIASTTPPLSETLPLTQDELKMRIRDLESSTNSLSRRIDLLEARLETKQDKPPVIITITNLIPTNWIWFTNGIQ